jgi:L-alanine-DL-glutamate epimerase-like enolase superfamily enzyme
MSIRSNLTIFSRRSAFKRALGASALAGLFKLAEPSTDAQGRAPGAPVTLNPNSAPSDLKITDVRALTIAANYDYPIIRIDTNQGVYGLGEVRDAGGKDNALIYKGLLLGKNPTQFRQILRQIRQFTSWGRQAGGYSAIDIALHDLAGKVQGVPAWRLEADAKKRDKVRIYADTTSSNDTKIYAERMRKRKEMGITFFKMDLQSSLVANKPGATSAGSRALNEKGLGYLCEFIAAIRDVIGDAPLAADHFGALTVEDAIRYAKAFEPYKLAWAEDLINWRDWRGYKQIKANTKTPILTGEDIFGLQGGFDELIRENAVDIVHCDPGSSGGIGETKVIADAAVKQSIQVAIHYAGSPVGCMAACHMIATIDNFVAMENHALDMPWWQDLVKGPPKPIIDKGYITVPDTPGIGVELNEDVVKEHLREPGYFASTKEFDNIKLMGFHSGGPWPHFDDDGKWCNCVSYE